MDKILINFSLLSISDGALTTPKKTEITSTCHPFIKKKKNRSKDDVFQIIPRNLFLYGYQSIDEISVPLMRDIK